MDKTTITIYYGDGKGKSSAAIGNAIGAAGVGKNTYIIQFMKGIQKSPYLTRLEPEVKFFSFEKSEASYDDLPEEQKIEERENIKNGLNFAKKALIAGQCDVLVLDEVLGLVSEGMATEDEIVEILEAKSPFTEVILTGRQKLEKICDLADEVILIKAEK